MKRYKVYITEEALGDMESIYRYIAEELLVPDMQGISIYVHL